MKSTFQEASKRLSHSGQSVIGLALYQELELGMICHMKFPEVLFFLYTDLINIVNSKEILLSHNLSKGGGVSLP